MNTTATNPLIGQGISTAFAPTVSEKAMSDAERRTMALLSMRLLNPAYQADLQLSRLYYDCLNIVPSLGISVPPELESLRGILGWCAAGVDARSERLTVMGFRMPGQTEIDDDFQQAWQDNDLDAEAPLVHDDAMICGRSFVILGTRESGDGPLITTEAPENMIGSWDVGTRDLSAAYQTYFVADPASPNYLKWMATFYTRMSTVHLVGDETGWRVFDRDDHNLGFVPVQMFAHKPSIRNRYGSSVMNAAWRNTQDRACRTLVRSEVAGEFFAALKLFLLGVPKDAFKNPDGSPASAWETFIGRISTLQADEHGNLPQIKEIRGDSPDGFIKTLDHCAQTMSSHTGLAPQYHGIFGDGNPASADAIRMSDFRLKTTADRLSVAFGNGWESVMRKSRLALGDTLPEGAARLETDWAYTGIPTPNADAVTVTTQMQAGAVPPTSDDALAAMGWSAVQRERMRAERKRVGGLAVIDNAIKSGLIPNGSPQQPMDGQQPAALAGLNSQRTVDAATAG